MSGEISSIVSLFKEQLENESTSLAKDYDLNERGDFLIWWYFLRLIGLEEGDLLNLICDGSADLGIDALWIDSAQIVHFYSFKNPVKAENNFSSGDVDKTLSGLRIILDRKHHSIANDELRCRIEDVYQTVPTGYRLHFVTSGTGIPLEAKTKLDSFVRSLGGPSENFFTWELEDLSKLQDSFYRKSLPSVEQPIDFGLEMAPYQVRASNHDSYLFHALGSVLALLYEAHGEGLLQQNIRVMSGSNATNNLIQKSATGSESANFFHYNNGVTFLCETAAWDGFTRLLTLRKAQIVNGGQTIRVIYQAHKNNSLKSDVLIPIRVITSQGDKEFASNVAVNLNNQNRVEPSFLRSNEPRVIQLANALASMGWYLERREGEVKSLTPIERTSIETSLGCALEGKVIALKEGSQAYVATYLRMPEIAKKDPKFIFMGDADKGIFEKVFGNGISADKFVNATLIFRNVEIYVKSFMAKKRKKPRNPGWLEDYKALLGEDLANKYGQFVDQIIPQSSTFLASLIYEKKIRQEGLREEDVIALLEGNRFGVLNELILEIIDTAEKEKLMLRSWPTLLKSQTFFERVSQRFSTTSPSEDEASLASLGFLFDISDL